MIDRILIRFFYFMHHSLEPVGDREVFNPSVKYNSVKAVPKVTGMWPRQPLVVLLLGSYDDDTRDLLYALKENIEIENAGGEGDVYVFVLERLSVYETDSGALFLEQIDENKYTAFLLTSTGNIRDVIDVKGDEKSIVSWVEEKYGIKVKRKLKEIDKLRSIIEYPLTITILVREKELTRCGEYIELAYISSLIAPEDMSWRVWFIKNANIPISTMAKEILTMTQMQFRTYRNKKELIDWATRIIYHVKEILEKT